MYITYIYIYNGSILFYYLHKIPKSRDYSISKKLRAKVNRFAAKNKKHLKKLLNSNYFAFILVEWFFFFFFGY